jgi:type II secretory pathway component PulK
MNLPLSNRNGSVLVIVLWITLGLVTMALYFANSMALELRASDNRAASLAADQAIEGAARYVSYILAECATNGVMPDVSEYEAEAVPVGDARFWLIGRDINSPQTRPDLVTFGLVDEASKLNLNSSSTNALAWLPGMNLDLLDAIVDWRNPNASGGSQLYYAMVKPPYQCKGASFESVDELRLVYGTSMDILVGNDINRNGILDAHEKDEGGSGVVEPGLLEYLTIYTREPNFHSDGTMRTNVNISIQLQPLLEAQFGQGRASQIMGQLGYTGRGGSPVGSFPSLLAFYLRSGMTTEEFALIYSDITVGTSRFKRGRVNVNTAPAAVLACLPGMDESSAQTLVSYRAASPDNLTTIAWIVEALGPTHPAIQTLALGDYITTRSYQFTADIAAVGPYGRGYRRVKFVFDITDGTPKILYRQDLSRLGWALGEDVRETLLANNMP